MKCDVVVIGAGAVGLMSALSLHNAGFKVVLLEARDEEKYFSKLQALRLYAISEGSLRVIEGLCKLTRAEINGQSINQIMVSDRTSMSSLTFNPHDVGLKNFGIMVDEAQLQKVLYDQVKQSEIQVIFGAKVDSVNESSIKTSNRKTIHAKLFVITDGKKSVTRNMLGIDARKHKYKQVAFVADVSHKLLHHGLAIENFTPQGPFAILPKLGGRISSIVWTMPLEFASTIKGLDNDTLNALINDRAANVLGEMELVSEYAFFELECMESKEAIADRFILLGDSLHSIHPIAGQGLNLSVRDLEVIVNATKEAKALGLDIGNNTILQDAYKKRELDNCVMANATTLLNALFSNNVPVIEAARSFGLEFVDMSTLAKSFFMNYASGV